MTCFRMKDGTPVRQMCKNSSEYSRFYRAIEKGMSTEEAFAVRNKEVHKGKISSSVKIKLQKVIKGYEERHYCMIMNYLGRRYTNSVDEAIEWAAITGRVTLKKPYRKEYLKRC